MTDWPWSMGDNGDSKASGLWNLMVGITLNSGREGWRKQVSGRMSRSSVLDMGGLTCQLDFEEDMLS